MAFKMNEFQQINLFDTAYSLSERNKLFLKKSWAPGFAERVFPAINEERFFVLYSDNPASRPNTPVNVVIGALLMKELFGLTDEELLESIFLMSDSNLHKVAEDGARILSALSDEETIQNLPEIAALKRLFAEQTQTNGKELKLKSAKDISTDSLQNPTR